MSDQPDQDQQLREKLDRIDSKAKSLKADIAESNEKIGYIAESVDTFKKGYTEILNQQSTQEDVGPTIAGGNIIASAIDQQLDGMLVRSDRLAYSIEAVLPIFATTSAVAYTAISSIAPEAVIVSYQPYPFGQQSNENEYARKLSELDPSLGETYRSAWSLFYTQQHDPKRASLWQMRQAFDHLFDTLAPDVKVRQSAFWTKKPGDKPDAVHRDERLCYAAHRCIGDEARRAPMLESVKETLRSYERLHEAHKRGALSHDKASGSFRATDSIIRRWVDTADQWPPK